MASITYGWDLETILRAFGISTDFAQMDRSLLKKHKEALSLSIEQLHEEIEDYPGIEIWLMCVQDSEINLMESKMVGISTMIGGFVPEIFWSLTPNAAIDDPLPVDDFHSLLSFAVDLKSRGIELPSPAVHFSGWHAEKLLLSPSESALD